MSEATTVERWIERISKGSAAIVALIVLIGFVIPPIGRVANMVSAWRFGAVGYAYYEIGRDRALSMDGRFYLPRAGSATYEDLSVGDLLQAADEVVLREAATKTSAALFQINARDCVIILAKDHPTPVTTAMSGGWLRVATTACGLFK